MLYTNIVNLKTDVAFNVRDVREKEQRRETEKDGR